MNGHIAAVHEGIKPYNCLKCDASFSLSHSLKKHITAVHEDKKPNKCNVCKKHFCTKYQMNEYIAAVHVGINWIVYNVIPPFHSHKVWKNIL